MADITCNQISARIKGGEGREGKGRGKNCLETLKNVQFDIRTMPYQSAEFLLLK